MGSLPYTLNNDNYTFCNTLTWGLCSGHYQKGTTESNWGDRLVHVLIAAAETIPLIGQIASLIEYIIVTCFSSSALSKAPARDQAPAPDQGTDTGRAPASDETQPGSSTPQPNSQEAPPRSKRSEGSQYPNGYLENVDRMKEGIARRLAKTFSSARWMTARGPAKEGPPKVYRDLSDGSRERVSGHMPRGLLLPTIKR